MVQSATSAAVDKKFLETIAHVGAAAAWRRSATLESASGYVANDTLNVACLGTGGRCMHLMKALVQVPGVRIAAVCDVYDARIHQIEEARGFQGDRHQTLSRAT